MELGPEFSLHPLLSKANRLFKQKEYFDSINKYNECVESLKRESDKGKTEKDLLLVAYSLRGMNYAAIRQFSKAIKDFELVLSQRPNDSTTIMRRASVYLKTKQYSKAMNDINRLLEIEPDSIRAAALLLEAKDKISKTPEGSTVSKSTKDEPTAASDNNEDLNEEQMLNFCNLKKIDRKSIQLPPKQGRVSTISFKEDEEFVYEENNEAPPRVRASIKDTLPREQIRALLDLQKIQDQQLQKYGPQPKISIVFKLPRQAKKSILKSSIRIPQQSTIESIGNPQEHALNAVSIKDVEGKVIRNSVSKVKFRNSRVFDPRVLPEIETPVKAGRKSCLKQSTFSSQVTKNIATVKEGGTPRASRGSSFIGLKFDSVDGKLLTRSEIVSSKKERSPKHNDGSSQSFDSGDEHNIFGCEMASGDLTEKIKKNMGITDSDKENMKGSSETTKSSKKSILKKVSIIREVSANKIEEAPSALKPKKSVLFKS